MKEWLRLQRYPDGSWTFGYEYITDISTTKYHWLSIDNDEEWKSLGKKNLQIILSGQKEQLHAVKDALSVVQQHMEEIAETEKVLPIIEKAIRAALKKNNIKNKDTILSRCSTSIANTLQINNIKNTIWHAWRNHEADKRISDTYYTCDKYYAYSRIGDFQEVIEDYTQVIEEIEDAITHLEKIYTSIAHSDNTDIPPILPWLRPDSYFQRGDRIFGWKASREWPTENNIYEYWEPYLDKVLTASDQKFTPTSGFLKNSYPMTSPKIMSMNEAVYYYEHDAYRQFLIEKMQWSTKSIDVTFCEILVALGNLNIFDFIKA